MAKTVVQSSHDERSRALHCSMARQIGHKAAIAIYCDHPPPKKQTFRLAYRVTLKGAAQ